MFICGEITLLILELQSFETWQYFLHRYIFPHVNAQYWAPSWIHQGISAHIGKASLRVSSPITTDDASCFDASRLSIKTSWLFILHVKPSCCSFKKLLQFSWWLTSCIYKHKKKNRWREGGSMHKMIEYLSKCPLPHFCLKVVCKKGGIFSGAFSILWYWWHTIAIWSNEALMLIVNLNHQYLLNKDSGGGTFTEMM